MEQEPRTTPLIGTPTEHTTSPTKREPDAIYQNDQVVAKALNAEVDLEVKEIRFAELYQSDNLMLPEECEYQNYKIMVQRIAYATKIEAGAAQKGRVLRGVVAEILGYRQQ